MGEVVSEGGVQGPVRAWKQAVLALRGGEVVFLPLTSASHYRADEDARCRRRRSHGASVPSSCRCGFYAFKEDQEARAHAQGSEDSVLIQVVGSGEVLEHETGYRMGHQRVVEVHVEWCSACAGRPASGLGPSRRWSDALSPLCVPCAQERGGFEVDLEDVRASLQAQVEPGRRVRVLRLGS
jgi:hypothetical protein